MSNHTDIFAFYDALAPDYDSMTGFENRFEREEPVIKKIVDHYSIRTALDAGAGTGFHSLLLAGMGVRVTAVDVSGDMIRQLQNNAEKLRLPVRAMAVRFEELDATIDARFDAVLCLGNSLVHILTNAKLEKALENFYSLLNPGGVLFIQILNYDRIMKKRKRVQNIKKIGDTTFIRFYDYSGDRLYFNLLKLIGKNDRIDHTINTVELRPLKKEELTGFLRRAGFTSIEHSGALQFEPFDEHASTNLVTVAKR